MPERRRFAESTTVAPAQTRMEIERALERYGATAFAVAVRGSDRAAVVFEMHGRQVCLELPLPSLDDFSRTSSGRAVCLLRT